MRQEACYHARDTQQELSCVANKGEALTREQNDKLGNILFRLKAKQEILKLFPDNGAESIFSIMTKFYQNNPLRTFWLEGYVTVASFECHQGLLTSALLRCSPLYLSHDLDQWTCISNTTPDVIRSERSECSGNPRLGLHLIHVYLWRRLT